MSVDFYSCDCCGEAVYEERIVSCAECGRDICDDCAVGSWEQMFKDCVNDDGELDPKYCPFCNGEIIDKADLLEFALQKLDMTVRELETEYRKEKGYELRFDT